MCIILFFFLVSTLSSDDVDEEEEDNLGRRSRERDCGTSSLQLSDSDEQQHLSADTRRGGTPTLLFSRHNKSRRNQGQFSSGYWKKRLSGGGGRGSDPASSLLFKKGDNCSSDVHTNSVNPIKMNLGMEDGRSEKIDDPFRPIDHSLEVHDLNCEAAKPKAMSAAAAAGIESDSLNENFSPVRPNTKRKRRFKRMALDPETNPEPSTTNSTPMKDTNDHITSKEVAAEEGSKDKTEQCNSDTVCSNGSKTMQQLSRGSAPSNDPSSSNTGTIKRKKVRSRSAGGTNQLQIMQNVKRVYHGATAHHSSAYPNATGISSKTVQCPPPLPVSAAALSPCITSVVPGKRKRSSNREKSVENDLSSHVHSYYRNRPTCVPSNPEPDIIFENILAANKSNVIVTDADNANRIHLKTAKLRRDSVQMDCDEEEAADKSDAISSSSLSSSDWASDDDLLQDGGHTGPTRMDGNLFGRNIDSDHEADDEQSDWPGQEEVFDEDSCSRIRGGKGPVFGLTDDELDNVMLDDPHSMIPVKCRDKNLYNTLTENNSTLLGSGETTMDQENLSTLTSTARQAYLARMKRLAECVPGREIRAGSRRVRSRQRGFTIKSSSSEQVSRFLQDSGRSELRLTVLRLADRNKIAHLANLYSLSMRYEDSPKGMTGTGLQQGGNMLVLTKTGRTLKVDRSPFVVPNTPSSSGGGNASGSVTSKHPIEVKRRRKSGPLQSSIASLSSLNLMADDAGAGGLKMIGGTANISDPSPNVNDRIGLMFETSFNPIVPSPVCLSSSMVAHQGSIPCSGAGGIELKECQDDDDRPAKSSSTSEEDNEEEESPLSSPIMEMAIVATTETTRKSHLVDTLILTDPIDGAGDGSPSNLYNQNST